MYGDPSRVLTNAIGPVETEDGPGGVGPGGVGSGAGDMAEGWGNGALRSGSSPHAATERQEQQTSARYFMTRIGTIGSPWGDGHRGASNGVVVPVVQQIPKFMRAQ